MNYSSNRDWGNSCDQKGTFIYCDWKDSSLSLQLKLNQDSIKSFSPWDRTAVKCVLLTDQSLTDLTLGAQEATGTGTDVGFNTGSSVQTERVAESCGGTHMVYTSFKNLRSFNCAQASCCTWVTCWSVPARLAFADIRWNTSSSIFTVPVTHHWHTNIIEHTLKNESWLLGFDDESNRRFSLWCVLLGVEIHRKIAL